MRISKVVLTFVLLILLQCIFPTDINAQYYFKDIWNTTLLNKEFTKLKNENLHQITTKSYEDDGTPSKGFTCEKRIDKDYKYSDMSSNSYITGAGNTITYYNETSQVIRVIDSSASAVNKTEYSYDHKRLRLLTTTTRSGDGNQNITESHEYFYNTAGQPEKMIRKKDGNEYSSVNFVLDKAGNVIEENEMIRGTLAKTYFYYYDDKNRLTDVVHNSVRAKRLLPDYVYEYDDNGNINQMISTEEGSSNYFIWKYDYDTRNLRTSENCFSKERRRLGTITYSYK